MAATHEPPLSSPPEQLAGLTAPPHNLEAEMSVLGAILISDRTLYALVIEEGLKPEDFYRDRHKVIYESMLALYHENEPIDGVTVSDHLKQRGVLDDLGGRSAVDALAAAPPSVSGARRYARIVRENSLLRRLLTTTYRIQSEVGERQFNARDLVERAEKAMLEVAHDDRQADFREISAILSDELQKMQLLSEQGTSLTGTPSGFKDLDEITGGFQPGNLIILAARPSMGKCLTGDSLIYDPVTGARRPLREAVAAHERGEPVWVASVGNDFRLHGARATAAFSTGRQDVFRVTTRLGRRIEATANHPLLTTDGWRRLDELEPGSRVAVPRALPRCGAPGDMPDHELVLLAALIADGDVTQRTPRFCYGADSAMLPIVEDAAAAIGLRLCHNGSGTATISAGRGSGANPLRALCERHGIWGCRANTTFVPETIFSLPEEQIERFLAVLYGCDGHIYASDRLRQIGYTTISERLARDVQHLLLRLGIVARIRSLKRPVYDGTGKVAREVLITGQDGVRTFCERIAVCGKSPALQRTVAGLATVRTGDTNVDTLPSELWSHILAAKGQEPWRAVSERTGRTPNHNWHVGRRGLSRRLLTELAEVLDDTRLDLLATSDLWWDEIASIEHIGTAETFDLTVPGAHNFVADDMVVHNSALVTNIAENAAIDHQRAVALFSLEMSETELAQRFVASQGRIFGDKLRKGRVPDGEWPRILEASQRLAKAPLYVDDSSDIGILDIRAKARRLHTQAPGGLGLIIIDYLQLLRPEPGVDNRVEQVGQMSRGLKILARELGVPVIALSQLSRAVEQRHDKKPILSDLRESGQIEQDADLVMFIYRDEYYNKDESEDQGLADLLIAKHRNGGLGDVTLTFRKEYPKFLNYAGDRYDR